MPPSVEIHRSPFTLIFTVWGVLEEKVMDDLARLIHYPDTNSYLLMIEPRVAQLVELDFPKNIVSSAKSR